MNHHIITEEVELPKRTLLDVWYELMARAMNTTKKEAEAILSTKK
jgi:hypothetical protein